MKLKTGEYMKLPPTLQIRQTQVEYKHKLFNFIEEGQDMQMQMLQNAIQFDAHFHIIDSNLSDEQFHEDIITINNFAKQAIPILILANKQDLPKAKTVAQIADLVQLQKLRNVQWYIQPGCAITGDGLYEGLDWLYSVLSKK